MNHTSSQSHLSLQQLASIQTQLTRKLATAKGIIALSSSDQPTRVAPDNLLSELEQLKRPQFDPNIDYNEQYWRVYLDNEIYCAQIKESSQTKSRLSDLVAQIEGLQNEHHRLNRLKNRKKNRRLAAQIEKSFMCPYHKCRKVYGSDVSLNLHIKIKHNGGNKTDREKLAESICAAEERGEPLPEMTLNLPPGYLNEYRKLYFQRDVDEGDAMPQGVESLQS